MDVHAHRHREARHHRSHSLSYLPRQRGAAGVAQTESGGAGVGRRRQRPQGILGVVAVPVEEVLRVVDETFAPADQEPHGILDHVQVLVAAHVQDLAQVQSPRLADDGHRLLVTVGEHLQAGVVLGAQSFAARHAEGDQLGIGQPLALHAREELDLLGVGGRKTTLDEVDAELVELESDAHLLLDRERHALLLHAVAEGRVVELYARLTHLVLPARVQ